MTTLEHVLALLPQLSAAERSRVLEVLESDPHITADRTNQTGLAHLDARLAADDDDDDSWWDAVIQAIDEDRLSNRSLFPDRSSRET
jgi:hypothetical protein